MYLSNQKILSGIDLSQPTHPQPVGDATVRVKDSVQSPAPSRVTLATLQAMAREGRKIAMLTCYDFPTAQLLSAAGVPALLVGDSAAMVVLGFDSTVHATVDFMTTITAAVRRGAPNRFVMGDMPFGSYNDETSAVKNAQRLIRDGGADAVKLECDASHTSVVAAISAAGVSVCAHLGLLPQRAAREGGYKAKGRTEAEAATIVSAASALTKAGAAMVLLEAVPNEVSARVRQAIDCPLIGCGAGPACDGHVLVLHDMLGFGQHRPRFAEPFADLPPLIQAAAENYRKDVEAGAYPAARHAYHMKVEKIKPGDGE